MKISQAKNYKKPLYAIGISAVIMATAVTGCTDLSTGHTGSRTKGDSDHKTEATEGPEVILGGDVVLDGEAVLYNVKDGGNYCGTEPTEEDGGVVLSGATSIKEPD